MDDSERGDVKRHVSAGIVGMIPDDVLSHFRRGTVIPAMPLALDAERRFDERRQRALVRYYIDSGAGGLAVGVHTTQFAIRDPGIGLLEPVLALASEAIDVHCAKMGRAFVKIAGVCGRTQQAVAEAYLARRLGYHLVLLSLGAFRADEPVEVLLEHCRAVAQVMPLVGFYLQPAVGGRPLAYQFWRAFAALDGVVGIKIAPFNRYRTLDVIRGVVDSGRSSAIALYTGNDDNIVGDLVTRYLFPTADGLESVRIAGGLLGQWAVWTRRAVALLAEIQYVRDSSTSVPAELLTLGAQLTDANAAIFDAAHGFAGCIAGIHEVLRRQRLLAGLWCLDPDETLSPGQLNEIERVYRSYPDLNDDAFVQAHLDDWLRD